MVDSLVCGVTGTYSVAAAWRSLVSPKDKVGIKVSATGRSVSGTNPEVVDAIVDGLAEAGIPAKNIIVWDKSIDDLLAAGFKKDGARYVLQGIDPKNGYDQQSGVSAPVLGKLIWGDSRFGDRRGHRFVDLLSSGEQLSSQSFFAKVLTTDVTKVINVPSLSDSYLTGINGGIVNMTLPNMDNWRRFAKAAAEGEFLYCGGLCRSTYSRKGRVNASRRTHSCNTRADRFPTQTSRLRTMLCLQARIR